MSRDICPPRSSGISFSDLFDFLVAIRNGRNENRGGTVVAYELPHLAPIVPCSLDKYHAGTAHATARPLPFGKFNAKEVHRLNANMFVARATFISGRNSSATVICRYGYSAAAERLQADAGRSVSSRKLAPHHGPADLASQSWERGTCVRKCSHTTDMRETAMS
jgi:hypothetical protein